MNQLRSWLYGRDVKNRWPNQSNEDENTENTRHISPQQRNLTENDTASNNFSNTDTAVAEVTDSQIRRYLLKVVPLQPGDCLGCKLVGTSVMAASGVIVLISAITGRARNPILLGQKRVTYNIVCASLFLGCEAAAICRFFDIGPFANIPEVQRQKHKD